VYPANKQNKTTNKLTPMKTYNLIRGVNEVRYIRRRQNRDTCTASWSHSARCE